MRKFKNILKKIKNTPIRTLSYEAMGWAGSILFALCAVPQAVQSFQQGHSDGLNWTFLMMWFWGEVLTFLYVLPTRKWPLLFNYVFNLACLVIIIYYKVVGG